MRFDFDDVVEQAAAPGASSTTEISEPIFRAYVIRGVVGFDRCDYSSAPADALIDGFRGGLDFA